MMTWAYRRHGGNSRETPTPTPPLATKSSTRLKANYPTELPILEDEVSDCDRIRSFYPSLLSSTLVHNFLFQRTKAAAEAGICIDRREVGRRLHLVLRAIHSQLEFYREDICDVFA
jgi:hypothetical protein